MIIARDINACEQAILENQYHDGVDLEEEFAHLVFVPQNTLQRERETPAQRLLREAAGMISDGERVLVYLLRLLRPRFLRRALDWKASVRDFVLDLILNDRVLTELTTAMGIADEFWVVVVQVLESGGLPGQRWVVGHKPFDGSSGQPSRKLLKQRKVENRQRLQVGDLRLVRSACSPKVLVPLAKCSELGSSLKAEGMEVSELLWFFGGTELCLCYYNATRCFGSLWLDGPGWNRPGQGDIFAPARNLVGSDESKCREGLRVTFESEIEARTNKPKATTWSILEGVIAAALPAAPGGLAGLAGGYGAIPNGYVDLQRYSPYGVAGLQTAAMPAGYGAVQGAMPGMAMGGVALSGGMPGALQGALPAGYAVLPGTAGVQLSAPTAVPALPPGWEQAVDPASGKVYYANRSTGETSWIPPAAAPTQLPPMLVAQTAPAAALATAPAQTQTAPAAAAAEATAPASEPATAPAEAAPAEAQADGTTAPAEASQAQPAEAQPALPAGWEQGVDATSGKTYYYNRATNQSSWTIPTA
ncbi:yki [Symbiodinium necroappetens]|uniref:Yki protein n=1 Tax=Symbiodinium necroappetens TaxID=1628268 RepID=A0A812L2S7_9DINO|nr:yki [Symbiodinium necroappetens]